MKNPIIYQEELRLFRDKYRMPEYDLNVVADAAYQLRYADTFLYGDAPATDPASQYIKWMSRTLTTYFNMHTQVNGEGKYLSFFYPEDFLKSFEALAEAKHFSDNEEPYPAREPYAGADPEAVKSVLYAQYQRMNKPLPTLWMERLKAGKMSLQELRQTTNNAVTAMNNTWVKDSNEKLGELTNVVAAHEAMKQLRASRSGVWGWLWKVIFQRGQNKQEKEYLAELENQLESLKESGYTFERLTDELTSRTVMGKSVKEAEEEAREAKARVEKAKQSKEKAVKSQPKASTLKPVADQLSQRVNDDYVGKVVTELIEELPGNNQGHIVRKFTFQQKLMSLHDRFDEINSNFDKEVANNVDPKQAMEKVVNDIFKVTVEMVAPTMIENDLEKAEGLKTAAQILINKFTAASVYSKQLSEAANTYLNQNVELYEKIVGEGKNYLEEIEKPQQSLEQDAIKENPPFEKAFENGDLFAEQIVDKAPPVSAPPTHNVPTVNNGTM